MKNKIKEIIESAVRELGQISDFSIEIPDDRNHGDYSTNVALILAKKINKNPIETANLIKDKIGSNNLFKEVKVAGPGFVNFFVADKIFIDNLENINKNYGRGKLLKDRKIVIDYTDPNPFKEFHIGHLMSNAIGESLSRIFEFQGAKIKRVCYQGDVGLHVAKAIWAILKNNVEPKNIAIEILGQMYAAGNLAYENDGQAKMEINEINKKIYDRSDKKINTIYDEGKEISLEHFNEIYKKLGTKFDYFIFESQVADLGKNIVEKGLKDGIFEKGRGRCGYF